VKFKFFSLKWKLSLSFVAMALIFVGLYVVVAKRTFESDKISYIFETQQRFVGRIAASATSQVERIIFDARSIAAGFDPVNKKFAAATQPIFWEHPQILALQMTVGPGDGVAIEKAAGLAKEAEARVDGDDKPTLTPLGGDRFAIDVRAPGKEGSAERAARLLIVFELQNLVTDTLAGQSVAVAAGPKVVKLSQNAELAASTIEQFLNAQNLTTQDTTLVQELDGRRHLVSVAQLGLGGLSVLSFVEESRALGALQVLFRRSMVFVAFSFFASIILSMLVSNRLTQNINSLTRSAEKVGKGDFSVKADFDSNDEVGLLSRTFFKMADEVQRLLLQMVDKIRMETELNTARLVQDSLFPHASSYKNGKVRLCGVYKTTSECGGDWWYYYQKGSHLYVMVADATGHGIPAALITAAARSLFAYIRDKDVDLKQIAAAWDKAVAECSNGKVYMTAFLLQVDVELGECRTINSCHDAPARLERADGKLKAAYLHAQRNHAIGEMKQEQWLEDRLQLNAGDRLVLFTDGLLAIQSPEGKSYSDKRFLKYLEKAAVNNPTPDQLVEIIDRDFTALGGGQPLPDDVTLVVLDFGA